MSRTAPRVRRSVRRRGTVMFVTIVCLSVVTLLAVGMAGLVVQLRRLHTTAERRLEAEWLAESGLDRAAARLRANPRYAGETWTLTPEDLALPSVNQGGAAVEIVVEAVPARDSIRRVRVTAEFPRGDPQAVRLSRSIDSFSLDVPVHRSSRP